MVFCGKVPLHENTKEEAPVKCGLKSGVVFGATVPLPEYTKEEASVKCSKVRRFDYMKTRRNRPQ